jgi:hypothetical protein
MNATLQNLPRDARRESIAHIHLAAADWLDHWRTQPATCDFRGASLAAAEITRR